MRGVIEKETLWDISARKTVRGAAQASGYANYTAKDSQTTPMSSTLPPIERDVLVHNLRYRSTVLPSGFGSISLREARNEFIHAGEASPFSSVARGST
jgi:hypothetical protein